MVTAHVQVQAGPEETPRRSATVGSLDARLSVWGQAARDASSRRAEAIVEGALSYVDRVGRSAEGLQIRPLDPAAALLDSEYDSLVELAANLVPSAVVQACRLLWVDPDRLRDRLNDALAPALEAARGEVRRRQALYRRRARLWQNDQPRLDRLRDEVEAIRVPRCSSTAPERVLRGLLERHAAQIAFDAPADAQLGSRLRVRPGTIARWIAQIDEKLALVTA